jgi:NAD(P)-dependent dehydrogenase (short-subunit alcohol dehydrogenase family)
MKTAIVLGGSTGIGFACAQSLAKQGHRVVLVARREAVLQKAEETLAHALGSSEHLMTFAGDITKKAELEALFTNVSKNFGGCDILINKHPAIHARTIGSPIPRRRILKEMM